MRTRPWSPHLLGIAWVLAAAGALVTPALVHGTALGPFDALTRYGLSAQPGVIPHYTGPADQIQQMIPWTALAWAQVHHGHLPLWNPYTALGTPLAFNWLSAPFSVPALFGYLVPLRFDFTLQLLVTLAIAGTGVYVLSRMLGLGVLGCAMAATTFELSGAFVGWLGWPLSSVMSWAGWLFAAALLVVRGDRRIRSVTLLALVVAAAIYAGQPDTVVELCLALVVFVVVVLTMRRAGRGPKPVMQPVTDVVVAFVAGAMLAAPLALPGLQVATQSIRRVVGSYGPLPVHDLTHVIFSDFDGLPVAGSQYFGGSVYPETAAYVGLIALVLAATALMARRGRPEVVALGVVAAAAFVVVFVPPVVSVLKTLPDGKEIAWQQALMPMDFALAVLAGVGADVIVSSRKQRPLWWMGSGFATVGAVLLALWAYGRGHLSAAEASVRAGSFVGPVVDAAVGLVVAGGAIIALKRAATRPIDRRWDHLHPGKVGAAVLLASETAFLVYAGAPLISSSPTYLTATPAEAALGRAVGTSVVGMGTTSCRRPPTLGIVPNVNVAFGIREFAAYDPMAPEAYFNTWKELTGQEAGIKADPLTFCPDVDSASLARLYGIGFILESMGRSGPRGATFVMQVGNEALYAVPGAAAATIVPMGSGGTWPPPSTPAARVVVTHPDPASWSMVVDAPVASALQLRLTDSPGWHATIDGRPVALRRFAGVMLELRVPAGRHRVELSYWPATLTIGIALATGAAGALVLVPLTMTLTRRCRGRVARFDTKRA